MNEMMEDHPCFSVSARHRSGRIHIPVASKCNIQCNYCNRKYDCANESRPGVTSVLLDPNQAMTYLDSVFARVDNIAVIGIAGPGDPMAEPEATLRTMELASEKYPDKILCLATNGLNLPDYVDRIAALNISHVTITMNAIEPAIIEKIYAWIRFGNRVLRGVDGANFLFERQVEAIRKLKSKNIIVKINTVVVPEINDSHVVDVAKLCGELGADVQNCIAMIPVEGTAFSNRVSPTTESMERIRQEAGKFIPQMTHCSRCRSDSVGLLGEDNGSDLAELLRAAAVVKTTSARPNVAVATREGMFVNRHLGETASLFVFGKRDNKIVLIEQRPTPPPGSGDARWEKLAADFNDCAAILVNGCGQSPLRVLEKSGLRVIVLEGLISESVPCIFAGNCLPKILLRTPGVCGSGCDTSRNGSRGMLRNSCGAGSMCGGRGDGCG
ncbi:MAG: nitrogenase cofactor biosynthesis protein NifB [Planctomycetaceae bacterium]|jgi:nitrogen fixation protein NifB|nr:nitrogenase cofactor biosynthesis protein NifB [Planctomycetaceae bacterium]